MKRFLPTAAIVVALLAIPASHLLGGKAHVPVHKAQVCHKGQTITVSENALPAHQRHGDCQIPACDFNNVFSTGEPCTIGNAGGQCDLSLLKDPVRDDAGGVTDACPVGTF